MPLRILITVRFLISLSLALFAGLAAHAQNADDFFNSGAQFYISNNIPAALEKTESGLKLYPDNMKLKKLEELLKQRQRQQNQKQKQQNQSQQQNSSSRKNQKQQKQQQQEQHKQNQSQRKKKPQQAQSAANQSKEKQNGQKEPAPPMAGKQQMSPKEAKRLLDAQKGNEQFLRLKPKVPPRNSQQPIEDW